MKNAVFYSLKSSQEKPTNKDDAIKGISNAIGTGARVTAYPINKYSFISATSTLFIGCEVNSKGGISRAIKKIIKDASADEVKMVAFFSVAKKESASALPGLKAILEPKNILLWEKEYRCTKDPKSRKAAFPSAQAKQDAQHFAEEILAQRKSAG